MHCRRIRELLPLYADGDLECPEAEAVARHLENCGECQERLALDRELAVALSEMPPVAAAEAMALRLGRKVMGQVNRERCPGPLWTAAGRLGNVVGWAAVGVVAAALVLAITLSWRPLAERAGWLGAPTEAPAGRPGYEILRDEVIAAPYYWPIDGERVDRTPQLSPDGSKLAYLPILQGQATDLDALRVRDLATGHDTDLSPEPGYSYASVRWSPDGRSLAFVKYRSDPNQSTAAEVWRIDADGQDLQLLHRAETGAGMRGPALFVTGWSADGHYVEVSPTIWSGGGPSLRLRADGSGAETISYPSAEDLGVPGEALVWRPVTSPDGTYALQAVKTAGLKDMPQGAPVDGCSLVLYNFQTRRASVLGSFPGTLSLSERSISPDGHDIALRVSGRGQLPEVWIVRLVRRNPAGQPVVDGQPRRLELRERGLVPSGDLIWSGVGRGYLAALPAVYSSSGGFLYAVDAESGALRLINPQWRLQDLIAVSPDGRRVVAITGGGEQAQLHVLEIAPAAPEGPTGTPAPQPTAAPVVAEPQFGAPRDLLELRPSIGPDLKLSPDGRWIAYIEGGQTLVVRDLANGQAVSQVDGLQGEIHFAWPPDSSGLVVAASGPQGKLMLVGIGPGAQSLATLPDGALGFGEAAVSPDGKRIAFTVHYPDNPAPVPKIAIDVMNRDGSGRRQIVEPAYFIEHLAWTPDGRQVIYFQGKGGTPPDDGQAYIVNADGGAAPQLALARAWLADWSPDGTQGLWLGEPPDANGKADLWLTGTLWPTTAEYVPIVRGVDAAGAAFAGNPGWVVYGQDGALYLKSVGPGADGRTRRLTPEGESAGLPVWLPGRGLAYRASRSDTASTFLRLLPLAGVEEGPLPTVAPPPTATPVPPLPLSAWAGWQGATGALAGEILFTNQGSEPYTLEGRPQVQVLDATMGTLAAQQVAMPGSADVGPVVLQPGQQASLQVVWRNYCGPKLNGPLSLEVTLPGRGELVVPVLDVDGKPDSHTPRCDVSAAASTLSVGVFELAEAATSPNPSQGLTLTSLQMVDATTGWTLSERAILRTGDGGSSWRDVTPKELRALVSGPDGPWRLAGSCFLDGQHAWVAVVDGSDTSFAVWYTTDGGDSWKRSDLPTSGVSAQFSFVDEQRGWMMLHLGAGAGSEGVAILGTEDGGKTWQQLSVTDPQNPVPGRPPFGGIKSGLGFSDASTGWLTGSSPVDGRVYLYVTHDGGRTWQEQAVPLPQGYEHAQGASQPPVFFGAQEGLLPVSLFQDKPALVLYATHDGGLSWAPTAPLTPGNGGLVTLCLASPQAGWALEAAVDDTTPRQLYRTLDSGQSWSPVKSKNGLQKVTQLSFVSDQLGWALGDGGLLKTTDGGATWGAVGRNE